MTTQLATVTSSEMKTEGTSTPRSPDGGSPFSLPIMSDSYPLDERERREIGELLVELEQEREAAQQPTGRD